MAFPQKNYVLGSGKIYFGQYAPGTRIATPQRYFGNTPQFNTSSDSESIDHMDADNGIRTKDDSALLQLNRNGSLITDHISPDNLALWFLGTAGIVTQTSATGQTDTFAAAVAGRRYQLGVTSSNPAGVRGVTVAVGGIVNNDTPTPGVLVEGTDYILDSATGGIEILPGSLLVDGVMDITVTYARTATSYTRVLSGSNQQIEGELLFRANNGKGINQDYFFPYVQLKPDGDYELKSEEWQQLGFTFEALKRDDQTEVVYINGRPGIGI